MRLRNWLLTGTSLFALALLPGVALAQQAEYQALVDAQASGDANAVDAAQQALKESCIANGYSNLDECIAAITGGGKPKAEEQAAPAEEPAPAAEAPAPAAEEPAPAAEEPAPAAQDAAPADQPAAEEAQPQADQPAEEAKPAKKSKQKPAEPSAEDQQAKFQADLQKAYNAYVAAVDEANGGNYKSAKKKADAAEGKMLKLCQDNGYADIQACIGQALPPFPEPAPAQEQPAAPEEQPAPAAEQPAAPAEQPAAPADQAPAEQPAAPADQQPAAPADQQPAAPADQPAADQPAAPADQPATEQPAADQQPAAPDPKAEAEAKLGTVAQLYSVGASQLDAGDASGQSTIDAANKQFADLCATLGINDVAQCLAQYGIDLPPLPTAPVAPKKPTETPIADLPGADVAVTPDATEVLPTSVKPEDAAPILDSAKDVQTDKADGATPPATPAAPAQPAGPPPDSDKAAQASFKPADIKPVNDEKGEKIDAAQLPPVEVPQNVTIINNITNVTNVTNITNNGGDGGKGGNGGKGDGQPGKGGDQPGKGGNQPGKGGDKPSYTNSGFIFQIGINLVLSNPGSDFDRISDNDDDNVYYERLPGGRIRETVERPDGSQVVTIRNKYGEVLKRSRITRDGREYVLAYYDVDSDNDDSDFGNWRDPGDDLPPLHLTIPVKDYILDADDADEDDVELFFRQPPVEHVQRIYTIDEVKRSARIRDTVRRVEVGGLTFDSGAATISRSQVGALSKVANAILALLEKNPAETFLIEGHTDAVGSDQANLILSDARATTVARILTDFYDIPPENLTTQGYGERYLKVKTEAAEPLNRRVDIKRITPLITLANN